MLPILIVVLIVLYFVLKYSRDELPRVAPSNSPVVYDYLIIGGGIAGLYAAKRLHEMGKNVLVLESSDRIGGRAYQINWHDTPIKLGAGIIRPGDSHLLKLCDELELPLVEFQQTSSIDMADSPFTSAQLAVLVGAVKDAVTASIDANDTSVYTMTFPQFLKQIIPNEYEKFLHHFGYKDMLNACAWDTIYNYPIEDVVAPDSAVPRYYIGDHNATSGWNALIGALCAGFLIYTNSRVVGIERAREFDKISPLAPMYVMTSRRKYAARNVIFATDKPGAEAILSHSNLDNDAFDFLHEIGTVSFVRGFSYYKNGYNKIAGFNITADTNRFIPYNDKVVMSIYDDDIAPDINTNWREIADARMTKYGVSVAPCDDFISKEWPVGIHYYKPRQTSNPSRDQLLYKWAQPVPNVYMCGEMISLSQGWVNGAIESVDRLMDILSDE